LEQQVQFIKEWQKGEKDFVALCREYNVTPKTGYKRVHRFERYGWEGLGDRSRAPHHHPNQVSVDVARLLLEAKQAHRTWGPRKLVPWLRERHPETSWPAPSTCGGILQRAGMVHPRRRKRRTPPWSEPFAHAAHPNDLWCMDFKGWFRTGDGQRCDPLTLLDAASRFLLACEVLDRPRGPQVKRVLERAFCAHGLPLAIRTDNGPPFASVGLGGLTPLAVWLIKLGITPERIRPGHPEENGELERLHRTLKAETASPPAQTHRAQQRTFDTFRTEYNTERPHEALGYRTPGHCYVPSFRAYPSKVPELDYEEGVAVRRVRTNGEIKWQGSLLYLSEALRGERVGLAAKDDRYWIIRLGPVQIGVYDAHTRNVLHVPAKVLPMCLD
jgi:transposase InsO family protein